MYNKSGFFLKSKYKRKGNLLGYLILSISKLVNNIIDTTHIDSQENISNLH